MPSKKKFNIESIIGKGSVSRPFCFYENGVEIKVDYNLDVYLEIIRQVAEDNPTIIKTQADFEYSLAQEIYGLLDNVEDDKKIDCSDKDLAKEKEKFRKEIYRKHNRIIKGMVGKPNIVSPDNICYYYLKKVEHRFKKQILIPIRNDIKYYHENMYIFLLVTQLLGIMASSEVFNYVPNSSNYQRECFCNHLKFIESNINEIFRSDSSYYAKWLEILKPFQKMIYECTFPGIYQSDIWFCQCKDLRFFDCSYEVARNYSTYCKIKNRLAFDLGNTQKEVIDEVEAADIFFETYTKPEKEIFCELMIKTLKKIVNKEFGLEVK